MNLFNKDKIAKSAIEHFTIELEYDPNNETVALALQLFILSPVSWTRRKRL